MQATRNYIHRRRRFYNLLALLLAALFISYIFWGIRAAAQCDPEDLICITTP